VTTIAGVDVTTLSDTNLAALASAISTEQVRRSNLASLPDQAASLASVFLAAGGNRAAIVAAVQNAQ